MKMSETFAEQYRALQKRINANTDKLCELKVKSDAADRMWESDNKKWDDCPKSMSTKSIDFHMRLNEKLIADFKEWREERDQIECDIVCFERENNQRHFESQIAELKEQIAESEKKN